MDIINKRLQEVTNDICVITDKTHFDLIWGFVMANEIQRRVNKFGSDFALKSDDIMQQIGFYQTIVDQLTIEGALVSALILKSSTDKIVNIFETDDDGITRINESNLTSALKHFNSAVTTKKDYFASPIETKVSEIMNDDCVRCDNVNKNIVWGYVMTNEMNKAILTSGSDNPDLHVFEEEISDYNDRIDQLKAAGDSTGAEILQNIVSRVSSALITSPRDGSKTISYPKLKEPLKYFDSAFTTREDYYPEGR